MMYMPATTLGAPVFLQQTSQAPLPSTSNYIMLQATSTLPTVPLLTSALMYPAYGFVPRPVEASTTKEEKPQSYEVAQPTQHVVHHHIQYGSAIPIATFAEVPQRPARSRSPSPAGHDQRRHSRRDDFERRNSHTTRWETTIDEKIERVRKELERNYVDKTNKSTETIDYYRPPANHYRPPATIEPPIPYKQHYDPPKPPSRPRSRPRSGSRPRSASLPREPWRSSNQNDYTWRDAHLPAYREASLSRSQTPVNQTRTWKETDTSNSSYVYRPSSETQARHYYTQTTGNDANTEVYHALNKNSTITYGYSAPSYERSTDHSFYADVPSYCAQGSMKYVDSTNNHQLYASKGSCLHIVPKNGTPSETPYLKILNAPVTYLH